MRLVSVNVGLPREISNGARTAVSGIYKSPVAGRVRLRRLNLDGDQQADLSVHGGPDKAVYVYPSEHYAAWRTELPDAELAWGAFGENFDTEGLLESDVCVGDELQIGAVHLQVTQPRMPCFKLGIRFGRDDMIERFLASRRSGFYVRVLQAADVGAGDAIEIVARDPQRVTIADLVRLYSRGRDDLATLRRAVAVPALPEGWRARFQRQLAQSDA